MNSTSLKYAKYWRNSLLDAGNGVGAKLPDDSIQCASSEVITGKLINPDDIAKLFLGEPDDVLVVGVVIRPMVYKSKLIHGTVQEAGFPDNIAPIVSNANIDRDGVIYPSNASIPRDLLEPLDFGSFSIGELSALDVF